MTKSNNSENEIKTQDIEKLVLEIAKEEKSPAKIGLILRDKHAIPKAKLAGKKISKILRENKIEPKLDSEFAKEKVESLNVHIKSHKHDYSAKRSLTKKLWVVNK